MALSKIKKFECELQRQSAIERADTIMTESPPLLREKVEWIRRTFEDDWRRSIVSRYQVAVIIQEIYDDVADNKGSKYGAKAVVAIKKAFGWDDGVIYQAINVANAFTPEQIEEITQMRLSGDRPLTYSHVVALARVEDDRKREKLLNQTVKEGWTTKKLANAVELVASPEIDKPPERRGRPLAKPKDFDAVLDQQAHFAEDFLNRNEHVWSHQEHGLSAKAERLDTTDFTQERANRLKLHADLMNRVSEKAKERAEEATRLQTVFTKVIAERAAKLKKIGTVARPDDDPA